MANIDVVRKRSNTVWYWVIALIIIAVVIGFFLMGGASHSATTPVSELLGPTLPVGTTTLV